MPEIGRGEADDLGLVVPAPHPDGGLGAGRRPEGRRRGGVERPALQRQALLRSGGELSEIARLGGAEIALGGNMQADGLADLKR